LSGSTGIGAVVSGELAMCSGGLGSKTNAGKSVKAKDWDFCRDLRDKKKKNIKRRLL